MKKAWFISSLLLLTAFYLLPISSFANNGSLDQGLVANWTFDGCTLLDYSDYGHHGSLIGGALSCTPGVKGNALKLTGDNYVDVQEKTALPVNNGNSFSISLWINYQGSLGQCDGTNKFETLGFPIQYNSKSATSFENQEHLAVSLFCPSHSGWKYAFSFSQYVYSELFVYPSGEPPIMSNRWYHIVYIMNRNTNQVEVYYNGVKGSGGSATPGFLINRVESFFTIGAGDITSYNFSPDDTITVSRSSGFKGLIDEIKIYNRIISPSEINVLYTRSYTNPEPVDYSTITPALQLLLL